MWEKENRKKKWNKMDKSTVSLINLYKKESIRIFNSIPMEKIIQFIKIIFQAYEDEKTIFAAGNGGSISYIQNMVVDFNLHVFVSEDKHSQTVPRNNFKCVNLCSDQAVITGIGNDLGLEFIFSEQLKYQGEKGDLFFGISGSGNSPNIIEALKISRQKGMKNILFTRNKINKCNEFADLVICPQGISFFPGQTGKNNINFHFEDILSKLTHIAVGLLKEKVHSND